MHSNSSSADLLQSGVLVAPQLVQMGLGCPSSVEPHDASVADFRSLVVSESSGGELGAEAENRRCCNLSVKSVYLELNLITIILIKTPYHS